MSALQYRRENNICEVGDLITHSMFWVLFEVKERMNFHVVGITPTGYESKLALTLISHATNEETKARKRL